MRPMQYPNATLQDVGDELLVLDRTRNHLHHLNATASLIFRRCDGTRSVNAIVDELTDRFAVERAVLERDLRETLRQLETLGLIVSAE